LSLSTVRAHLKKLEGEVDTLKRVPVPAPDIREKVQAYVQGVTRPAIRGIGAGEALSVQWPTELHVLMAFLQPQVLVERLRVEIDRIADTPCSLPEREQRIAELEQEIERLQAAACVLVVLRISSLRTHQR
jgi:hypothetical protein